jgi:hypothetical protein
MDTIDPQLRDVIGHQLGLVLQTAEARVLPNTQRRYRRWFEIWKQFLHSLGPIYPSLTVRDHFLRHTSSDLERVQTLLLFAWRIRTGEISPSRQPTGTGTVDEALRAVSSFFELAGHWDPRR